MHSDVRSDFVCMQRDIDVQYKGLRKIVKLLKEADEQLGKSKNHKAMEVLSEALSAMKGMDVSSGMFRYRSCLLCMGLSSDCTQNRE